MAKMTYWRHPDGKIVVDEDGKWIQCDHCPCDYSVLVLKLTEEPRDLTQCPPTYMPEQYSSKTVVTLRKEKAPYTRQADEFQLGSAFPTSSTADEHNKACVSFDLFDITKKGSVALVAYIKASERVALCGSANKEFYEKLTIYVAETYYPYRDHTALPDAYLSAFVTDNYAAGCTHPEPERLTVKYQYMACGVRGRFTYKAAGNETLKGPIYAWGGRCEEAINFTLYPETADSVEIEIIELDDNGVEQERITTRTVPKGGLKVSSVVSCDTLYSGLLEIRTLKDQLTQPTGPEHTAYLSITRPGTYTITPKPAPADAAGIKVLSLKSTISATTGNTQGLVATDKETKTVTLTAGKSTTQTDVKLRGDRGVSWVAGSCN